jgi:hypothetical protein
MDPLAPSITFFDKETGKGRVTYIGTSEGKLWGRAIWGVPLGGTNFGNDTRVVVTARARQTHRVDRATTGITTRRSPRVVAGVVSVGVGSTPFDLPHSHSFISPNFCQKTFPNFCPKKNRKPEPRPALLPHARAVVHQPGPRGAPRATRPSLPLSTARARVHAFIPCSPTRAHPLAFCCSFGNSSPFAKISFTSNKPRTEKKNVSLASRSAPGCTDD